MFSYIKPSFFFFFGKNTGKKLGMEWASLLECLLLCLAAQLQAGIGIPKECHSVSNCKKCNSSLILGSEVTILSFFFFLLYQFQRQRQGGHPRNGGPRQRRRSDHLRAA